MAIIAKIIFRTGLLFGFGLGIVCKGITPKFFRSGNLFMKAKDLSRSSSFSASCCISWQPLGNKNNYLYGLTCLYMNYLESSQFVTVSCCPWKIMIGYLNYPDFNLTKSNDSKMYLAIFTDIKGIISLSSKIVCKYFVFLVNAVGFTLEFTMKSAKCSPKCLMKNFLT